MNKIAVSFGPPEAQESYSIREIEKILCGLYEEYLDSIGKDSLSRVVFDPDNEDYVISLRVSVRKKTKVQ